MRDQGYLALRGILRDMEIATIRAESAVEPGEPFLAFPGSTGAFYAIKAKQIVEGLFGRTVVELGPTLLPKAPGEPERGWHQDWPYWNNPRSLDEEPLEVGVLFYPNGANVQRGGVLRVIPESHRRWTSTHARLVEERGDCSEGGRPRESVFDSEEAVTIEADPSDVILIDSRTLHSVTASKSEEVRPCVNVWCWLEGKMLTFQPQPWPLRDREAAP